MARRGMIREKVSIEKKKMLHFKMISFERIESNQCSAVIEQNVVHGRNARKLSRVLIISLSPRIVIENEIKKQ